MKFFQDKWTGPDKTKHAAIGLGIAFIVSAVTNSALVGFILGTIAGFGKEVYDKASDKGTPSFQDFAVTVGGSAIGAVIFHVIAG